MNLRPSGHQNDLKESIREKLRLGSRGTVDRFHERDGFAAFHGGSSGRH